MRTRTALLLAACALVLVPACGSAQEAVDSGRSEPTGSPPTTTPTPTATPTTPQVPVDKSLPNIIGSVNAFSSPTGNIGCYLSNDAARCDIRERTFTPPPEPAECGLDWGNAVEVAAGRAGFACVGDTVMGSETTLKYGNSTVVGDFGCRSSKAGVTCINRRTMHGFSIARAAVRTF